MLKDKEILVKVYNNTISYYKNLGYDCKVNDVISIKIEDLPKQSTYKVLAICDICGKEKLVEYRKYMNNIQNKNFYVCSLSCAQSKIKITKKENYGDENFSNIKQREITCEQKYGDKNFKNVKKRKVTNLKKYGVEHVIQNSDIKEKRTVTYLNKYGYDSPIKNNKIKNKRKRTLLTKYGNDKYNNIEKTLNTIKSKNIENIKNKFYIENIIDYKDKLFIIKCDQNHEYKISYDLIYKRWKYGNCMCTICNPVGVKFSDSENNLFNFIKENYNEEIIRNSREIIKPYEIDIYLPKLKLAFEFNGLFWHSELYRDKDYHINKFKMCEKNNIHLIQFFEDDWNYRQDIVKSMILNKLNKIDNKIYARKCEIKEINDNALVRDFLEKNHIQGYVHSTIKIGLFYNEELISLMTFLSDKNNYILNRFCSKINVNIIGGASKLFNYFIKNYKFNNITTFSNNSYSNGELYKILNFRKIYEIKEDYSYIKENKRYHKFLFRKKKNQINSERDETLNNNLFRIYDAGKIKFIYP